MSVWYRIVEYVVYCVDAYDLLWLVSVRGYLQLEGDTYCYV